MKKKFKLVMLSSEKADLWSYKGRRLYYNQANFNDEDSTIYYHLYITSNEKIKEDDWHINALGEIAQFIKGTTIRSDYPKIIASTDKALNLPTIPKSYIEYFIEEWNKSNKIEEIELEMEEDFDLIGNEAISLGVELKLQNNEVVPVYKLDSPIWNMNISNSNNQIMYSEKEIRKLLLKLSQDICNYGQYLTLDQWFEQNKK